MTATAFLDKSYHPFTQINAIGFHALKPVRLGANVNMKCYNCSNYETFDINVLPSTFPNNQPRKTRKPSKKIHVGRLA